MVRTVSRFVVFVPVLACGALVGCSSPRPSGNVLVATPEGERLVASSGATVERMRRELPSLGWYFDNSAGYAVFPRVTKGAAGIGAAHGEGVLVEGGELVAFVDLTQTTLGAQFGGQSYSQIVFFEHADVMRDFKRGNYELAAGASAVAIEQGAVAANNFDTGAAVFTQTESGLMFEASIGGQKFDIRPVYR